MIVDTSALLAYFDSAEPAHDRVTAVIEADSGPFPFGAASRWKSDGDHG